MVKIAVCQLGIRVFDPVVNLKRIETFVRRASGKADIIVFPENAVTGCIENNTALADTSKRYVRFFRSLAKKYKLALVPGSIVEREGGQFFNMTYYIDARGRILLQYRKINLWHTERHAFTPGSVVPVVKTKFGRIGLMICWDIMFPELFREMVASSVDIIICPSNWSYEDAGIGLQYDYNADVTLIDAISISRAYEHEVAFVFCNPAHIGDKIAKATPFGHSQITVPFKGVLKKFDHNREGMFIKEIDMTIVHDARSVYKIRPDLSDGMYAKSTVLSSSLVQKPL